MIINTESHLLDDQALARAARAAGLLRGSSAPYIAQRVVEIYLGALEETKPEPAAKPPLPSGSFPFLFHRSMAEVDGEQAA